MRRAGGSPRRLWQRPAPRRCSSCRRRPGRCAASSSPGRRRSGARRRGRRRSTAPASIPGRRAGSTTGRIVPSAPARSIRLFGGGPAVALRRPMLSEGRVGTIGPAGSTLRAVRVAAPGGRVEAHAQVELAARQRHPVRAAVDLGAGRPALRRPGRRRRLAPGRRVHGQGRLGPVGRRPIRGHRLCRRRGRLGRRAAAGSSARAGPAASSSSANPAKVSEGRRLMTRCAST